MKTNILEKRQLFFTIFFLQRRTPDELNNFKNINSSLQLLGGDYTFAFSSRSTAKPAD